MRTYKQKFTECERSNRLMWKSLEIWHRVVAESLTGGARFIARVPGNYTGETHTIYLLHRTGQVVVVMEGGDTSWTERTASLFESVADAMELYGKLACPWNVKIGEAIAAIEVTQ